MKSIIIFVMVLLISIDDVKLTGDNIISEPKKTKPLFCYSTMWKEMAPAVNIKDFDSNLCTHMIYTDGESDILANSLSATLQDDVAALKRKNPKIKMLFAITYNKGKHSTYIQRAAANEKSTNDFIKSLSKLKASPYNFDGIDIPFDYIENFTVQEDTITALFNKIKVELGQNFILTTTVIRCRELGAHEKFLRLFTETIDYTHALCFDQNNLHAQSQRTKEIESGFKYFTPLNFHQTLSSHGVSADKIIIGIWNFLLVFNYDDAEKLGDLTFDKYSSICFLTKRGYRIINSEPNDLTDMVITKAKRNNLISIYHHNPESIQKFVVESGSKVGGFISALVETDDITGACNQAIDNNGLTKYPLLRTLKEAMSKITYEYAVETGNNGFVNTEKPINQITPIATTELIEYFNPFRFSGSEKQYLSYSIIIASILIIINFN